MSNYLHADYECVQSLDIDGNIKDTMYQCHIVDGYGEACVAFYPSFEELRKHCNESTIFNILAMGNEDAMGLYQSAKTNGGTMLCDTWVPFVPISAEQVALMSQGIEAFMLVDAAKEEVQATDGLGNSIIMNPPLSPGQHIVVPDIPSVTSLYMVQTLPPDGVTFVTKTTTVSIGAEPPKYIIQELMTSGWEDSDWTVDGEPQSFKSIEDAQADLDSFIRETQEAFKAGNLAEEYHADNFRIVEVPNDN